MVFVLNGIRIARECENALMSSSESLPVNGTIVSVVISCAYLGALDRSIYVYARGWKMTFLGEMMLCSNEFPNCLICIQYNVISRRFPTSITHYGVEHCEDPDTERQYSAPYSTVYVIATDGRSVGV